MLAVFIFFISRYLGKEIEVREEILNIQRGSETCPRISKENIGNRRIDTDFISSSLLLQNASQLAGLTKYNSKGGMANLEKTKSDFYCKIQVFILIIMSYLSTAKQFEYFQRQAAIHNQPKGFISQIPTPG